MSEDSRARSRAACSLEIGCGLGGASGSDPGATNPRKARVSLLAGVGAGDASDSREAGCAFGALPAASTGSVAPGGSPLGARELTLSTVSMVKTPLTTPIPNHFRTLTAPTVADVPLAAVVVAATSVAAAA